MPTPLDRLTSALADRYHVERELGQGGMATVYLAQDLRHHRPVALKVLRPELSAILGADRFLAEIRTTANLQHPHILPLHDSGEADGLVYYVMPFVEGESLRDRLAREHQLPVEDAVRIAIEVADALQYAHQHGVVHRDIKPENILLHGGHALVADFGIALAASKSDGGTRMTETGMSLGTPHYMAPEQAMGEREITPKADVYALGCVLYEMLCGEPPFTGPTAQAIIARVMTEEPRSLTLQRKTIPPAVEAVVRTALQKLPADRFATAAQFAEALSHPGSVLLPTLQAPATSGPTANWRHRFQLVATVALLALAAAIWGWTRGAWTRAEPSWSYITLGDTLPVGTLAPALALSPDGQSLVFKLGTGAGDLWIKRRGQLDPQPLPGTEHARGPVFSPDGKWVSFQADGLLKKVSLIGGGAVTVADSAWPSTAAWLDDGTMVYSVYSGPEELRRVSAAGGPSQAALLDSSIAGLAVSGLAPLPQGRGVLFVTCNANCVGMNLRALDLRTHTQNLVIANAVQGWYLPSGRLLYVRRDGAVLVAPFDLGRLEISGPAVPVLEGVQVGPGFAELAWSPSGAMLYVRGRGLGEAGVLNRVDRSGQVTAIDDNWEAPFNSIALSRDGRRLAAAVGGASGALNVWTRAMGRGPATRLSFGGQDRRPAWSPDGRLVAFVRDTGASSVIMTRPADGAGADRLLARLDRMVQEVAWSPDGRWLVLRTDNGGAGAGDLIGVRTSGDTTPVVLVASPFTELQPAVSPDGRWLAYASNESGTFEVYVRPFPNTNDGRWQVSSGGGSEPRWSGDGRELFFLDRNFSMVGVPVRSTPSFAAGDPHQLFDASGFNIETFHQGYDVSPDGRWFLFIGRREPRAGGTHQSLVLVEHWLTEVEGKVGR